MSYAAAGGLTPMTSITAQTHATLDGVKLSNANGEECGGSLALAFAVSCNSVFAPLGVKLGAPRLVAMAERFGFNHDPGIAGAAESTLPAANEIQGELDVGFYLGDHQEDGPQGATGKAAKPLQSRTLSRFAYRVVAPAGWGPAASASEPLIRSCRRWTAASALSASARVPRKTVSWILAVRARRVNGHSPDFVLSIVPV